MSDTCRACGSPVEEVLDLGLHYLADFLEPGEERGQEYPLRLALCRICTLLQLLDVVPSEAVLHDRYAFRSGINESIRADLKSIAEYADAHSWNSPRFRNWLDTGSNDGTLLSNVDPYRYHRIGVDPLKHLADDCKRHADEVIADYFDPNLFEGREMHVVTSSAMFYNLADPRGFTEGVRRVLARNGVWVIQQNYSLDMLRNNVVDNVVHEHVTYFSVASLKRLMNEHGLQVTDVSYSDAKGGCIRTAIHHKGVREIQPSVQQALSREQGYRLGEPATWHRWGQRARLVLAETRAELEAARDRGWRSYLYGASIRGSTFLRLIDAGPDLLPLCTDRDEAKVGKIMATTGIPIISEAEMRADPPDYLLIGPWFFRDLFVQREQGFLHGGGRFIVPLPSFEVIGA